MKKYILLLSFMSLYPHLNAQVNLDYQKPDKAILELADVPLPPATFVDAKGENAFMAYRNRYKSIAELSETEMRLGGLRINPKTNINSREIFYFNLTYYDLKTGKEITIKGLNKDGRYSNFGWSYDQKMLSFTNTTDKGVELWVIDVGSKSAKRIVDAELNANLGKPYSWLPNNSSLLVSILPKTRAALINTKEHIPSGPIISESDGREAQNRTYQDLLQNKEDEFNFELLTTSEIYKVNLKGEKTIWKASGIYTSLTPSPNGAYVLVTEIHKPFSYLVPYQRFPFTETIYDENAKLVKEVMNAPLEEDRPKGFMSTRKGIRSVGWRLDQEANIYWAEALDEGDAETKVDFRDAVFELQAPFNGEKRLLLKTTDRFAGIDWGTHEMAVAYDYWWNTRNHRAYLFNPSDNKLAPKAFHNRNYQDKYNDPGSFITERNQYGRQQLLIEKGNLLLKGEGYSAEGILPFIDEFDLKTLKTARLWRALKGNQLESIISIINPKKGLILERIESKTAYPNYYIRNIFQKGGVPKQVTFFENPFESLQNVHKEIITYKREDGVKLSATLYLPPQYNKKEKLPMLMWAYPQEFKDNATAGQITSSSNEFIAPWYGSPIFWVMRGYAVLDDAAFPIVGEGDNEPNDTFIPQLVENAKAAIDAVDKLGYIDRERVAVGGHSYGAFMTANLLSHSNLFAAGIARSGAYNRTLTPFGFQAEERNYWQAAEVYNNMSPFMSADKMKHPLLLVHGEEDNNSGTYPMQSERYFNALKGLGATARLVILPKESHGYASKESVLHLLWEQDQWLEKYVKNKTKTEKN